MSPTTLAPIPRKTLSREVVERLRQAILSGALAAGAPLPEAATATKLRVSRVPVREALVELDREGLIQFDANGRAAVRDFSPEDVHEILSLRSALQRMAAGLAAQNLQDSDLGRLTDLLTRASRTRDLTDFSALDMAFHDMVVEIARHERLSRVWNELRGQMQLWLLRLHLKREKKKHDVREETFRSHHEFIRVLSRRKPAEAAAWMEEHCNSWSRVLPEID